MPWLWMLPVVEREALKNQPQGEAEAELITWLCPAGGWSCPSRLASGGWWQLQLETCCGDVNWCCEG